jgi:hypothetical protein
LQIMIPIIAFLLSCSALFSSPILLRSHHLHILSLKFLLNLMAPASLPILLLRLSLQQRPFKSPPLQHTGDLLHAPCPASTTCMHEPMHCTLTPMQDPKSQFSGSALLISTPSAFSIFHPTFGIHFESFHSPYLRRIPYPNRPDLLT